jgi:hypothetical protein
MSQIDALIRVVMDEKVVQSTAMTETEPLAMDARRYVVWRKGGLARQSMAMLTAADEHLIVKHREEADNHVWLELTEFQFASLQFHVLTWTGRQTPPKKELLLVSDILQYVCQRHCTRLFGAVCLRK